MVPVIVFRILRTRLLMAASGSLIIVGVRKSSAFLKIISGVIEDRSGTI